MSLTQNIIEMLVNRNEWLNGGEIERMALGMGYKASNASRRCREMQNKGKIEREERQGEYTKSVWYRINNKEIIEI